MAKQCKALKKNGQRCTAYAVKDSAYCLTHSPERASERAERNRKGGRARQTPKATAGEPAIVLATITDVLRLVNAVVRDLWLQENTAPRARALLAAGELAIKAMQLGDLEERVRKLEQAKEAKE